jgi:hypothetical protein
MPAVRPKVVGAGRFREAHHLTLGTTETPICWTLGSISRVFDVLFWLCGWRRPASERATHFEREHESNNVSNPESARKMIGMVTAMNGNA